HTSEPTYAKLMKFPKDSHRLSTYHLIKSLTNAASKRRKMGSVATQLVWASLELYSRSFNVGLKVVCSAKKQRGRHGDFRMGNTVFHVTVSPGPLVFEKCEANVRQGLQVYLIVPESSAVGTKQNAEQIAPGKISVVSIEGFVSQNVDELGEFSSRLRLEQIALLLTTYNKRVDAIEADKSLLIKLPTALLESDQGSSP
ncbi:MAG: DUF4928 family protein, partial [Actinomycetota bacterium]